MAAGSQSRTWWAGSSGLACWCVVPDCPKPKAKQPQRDRKVQFTLPRDCPLAREPSHPSFSTVHLHLRSRPLSDTISNIPSDPYTRHLLLCCCCFPTAIQHISSDDTSQIPPTWWARSQDAPSYGKKVSILFHKTDRTGMRRQRRVLRTLPPCAEQMLHLATHRFAHPLPSLYAPG